MRVRKHLFELFVILISFIASLNIYAFEGATHSQINQYIAENSIGGFSLDEYTKSQLGFTKGVATVFKQYEGQNIDGETPTISRWLGYGGRMEDEPIIRTRHHFHNPLRTWNEAGLIYRTALGRSSIVWAQGEYQIAEGNFSWQDVRNYFYLALTLKYQSVREYNFTWTFRGLGQLMHLVSDASVPEHSRNDQHAFQFTYERWVDQFRQNELTIFNQWLSNTIRYGYDKSVLKITPDLLAPVPIARIVDTDKYHQNGDNPRVTLDESIGISEYSNANFLSLNTNFESFPHPGRDDVQAINFEIENPRDSSSMVRRPYYWKTINPAAIDGDTGYRLATVSYLCDYARLYFPTDLDEARINERPALDSYVYEDYASRLVPRAVGYSAGLLEYFFRGKFDVTSLPIFDENNLRVLSLKIKNMTSSQEIMSDGYFDLILRYNDGNNGKFVSVHNVSSGTLEFDNEVEINFILPSSSDDEIITKEEYESGVTCTLVFKGKLGNENGAVVAKSFVLGEEVKFDEDWDNDLTGNYPWTHSTSEQNPPNGETINVVENGILTKENVRYAEFATPRNNETFLYLPEPGIPISQYTSLQFKIDELSINNRPPDGYHWQVMMLYFNDGEFNLQFSIDGQWGDLGWPNVGYYSFIPEIVNVENIQKMFNDVGIQVPESLYLNRIGFGQQLLELPDLSTTQHTQRMKVDFIRVIDAKPNP